MKKISILLFLCFFYQIAFSQEVLKTIKGKVTDGFESLSNVNITVENTERGTQTDDAGSYAIQARAGETLKYTYVGKKPVEIRVTDITEFLNVTMHGEVNELDGVLVTKRKRRTQADLFNDYNVNKNLIKTSFGIIDKERSGFAITVVDGEDLNLAGSDFTFALPGVLPGINIIRPLGSLDPQVYLPRRFMSLLRPRPVLFEVDGSIFTEAPLFVEVSDIERIAVIGASAASARYGSLAAGGLIVINTKAGNFSPTKEQLAYQDQQALKKTNFIMKALSEEEVANNAPSYLKELRASSSFGESKAVFDKHRYTYANSPYFFLDVYTHIVEVHEENAFADQLIDERFNAYTNNAALMNALAYIYESQQRFEKANDTYKEVFILRPNYVQSYMDMANSYRNLKEYRQAASMYARYNYLIDEGFLEQDTLDFDPLIQREYNNLLSQAKDAVIETSKYKKTLVAEKDFEGTRIVFEWNDSEAEFALQFVNPENQYTEWEHSMAFNAEGIAREKDFGYNVKEYLVGSSQPGTWMVNINYFGNKSLTPTYLKATLYHEYGSDRQRKEVKVFKLDLKNVNQELFKVNAISNTLVR